MEIDLLKNDLLNTLYNLKNWMKPDYVSMYIFLLH